LLAVGLTATLSVGAADSPHVQVEALYNLSGLEAQIAAIEPQLLANLETEKLPADDSAVVAEVVSKLFSRDALRDRAIAVIDGAYAPELAADAIRWLQTDVGRQIVEREEFVATAAGSAALDSYAKALEPELIPARRLELVQRLEAAYSGAELMVDATLAMTVAIAVGINAASPDEPVVPVADMRELLNENRDRIQLQMDQFALIYYLYTYDELSDEALASYVEFLESEAGVWYSSTLAVAYLRPLNSLSDELELALLSAFNRQTAG